MNHDQLETDINMLLSSEIINAAELREICTAISCVNESLEVLYRLIEKHLPHKTNGRCNELDVIGRNGLLSLLFSIQDEYVQFSSDIDRIRQRSERILAGKEQRGLF